MTSEGFFAESIGPRLKSARLQRNMTPEQVARKLRLPTAVIDAIEAEEWQKLGAPLYVRSHTKAYAEMMSVPFDYAELSSPVAEPSLAPMPVSAVGRRKFKMSPLGRNVLVFGILVIAAAYAWSAWQNYQATLSASVTPEDSAVTLTQSQQLPLAPSTAIDGSQSSTDVSLADGSSAMPASTAVSESAEQEIPTVQGMLSFELTASCWVDVVDANGRRIESGLLGAGQSRTFPISRVGRATFGNASAVELQLDGKRVDLAPFKTANVVKFAVSSDGRIVADNR